VTATNHRRRLLGYVLIIAAASLWGTLGIAARSLYSGGISPGAAVTLRAAVAAVVLFTALAIVRPAWLRVQLRDLPFFAAYGLVSVAAFYWLYFYTIQRIPVAAASVLLYTAPAFVAIAASLTLGERLTGRKLAVLVLTMAGCFLVARAYVPAVFKVQALGLLTGLGSGFTYGMYSIFGKLGLRKYNPWAVMAYSLLAGSIPLVVLYGREAAVAVASSPHLIGQVAYLSLVTTLGAYGLYLTGLQHVEASHASILATIEPVVAALLGYWMLGEPLELLQIAGVVLVLGSAVLLNLPHRAELATLQQTREVENSGR
jgi:drug/metabolite transporter (DMT)-like permease